MIDIVGDRAHACARCQCLVLDASREDARHRRCLLEHLNPSLVLKARHCMNAGNRRTYNSAQDEAAG